MSKKKFDINELEENFEVVLYEENNGENYVLLVDGTVIKLGEDGNYFEVDKNIDKFAQELYDSAHSYTDKRVYRIIDENGNPVNIDDMEK